MVVEINRMIHPKWGGGGVRKNALFFKQILPTSSLRKGMKISVKNLYLYIGAHGVRFIPLK